MIFLTSIIKDLMMLNVKILFLITVVTVFLPKILVSCHYMNQDNQGNGRFLKIVRSPAILSETELSKDAETDCSVHLTFCEALDKICFMA